MRGLRFRALAHTKQPPEIALEEIVSAAVEKGS